MYICILFCLQGNLTYVAEGIYPADYFFAINPVSGQITVANDLKTDELSRSSYEVQIFSLCFSFWHQIYMSVISDVIVVVNSPS